VQANHEMWMAFRVAHHCTRFPFSSYCIAAIRQYTCLLILLDFAFLLLEKQGKNLVHFPYLSYLIASSIPSILHIKPSILRLKMLLIALLSSPHLVSLQTGASQAAIHSVLVYASMTLISTCCMATAMITAKSSKLQHSISTNPLKITTVH
jgi:hypothetical protein